MVTRRFTTWKIRHATGETYECDREFERKRRTNVCNSADVEDSPHNGDKLGSGGGVGSRGLGLEGLGSGGVGVMGLGSRGWGGWNRGLGWGGWVVYVSPAVWRIFFVANFLWRIFYGESSMWRILWQPFP